MEVHLADFCLRLPVRTRISVNRLNCIITIQPSTSHFNFKLQFLDTRHKLPIFFILSPPKFTASFNPCSPP
ncbi:hypothetical protein TsFJ059_000200 [Trichoderma semiorbis]|uniref:Uncharacterized protein n=1 Tax=Trichoderma semiorbis TaxID=1491008 RepID=A0A9P8HWR4_9HYPO|nr:hypothetical protein TsFJ059_000200 [Trichoderma semiorbis]